MIKNFNRKILLSPQGKTPPRYFVSLTTQKGVELKCADPRIQRVALALMDMQAVLGGAASHWGGPSAFAEIVSALYGLMFYQADQKNLPWYQLFHLINDAGHCENGLYALRANYGLGNLSFKDLKGFRSFDSPLTGHGEAHLFPEGVYLSNGPLASTIGQAQGLCMADRLAEQKRTTVVLMSDGACMEGEAKESFNSIPGFFEQNKMNPLIVIVSDNNTKLSGRIDKDSFSLEPFFNSLEVMGWNYIKLQNAHDLSACVNTLEEVLTLAWEEQVKQPIFIHAKTIKGRGVKQTEMAMDGGHGFPLKNTEHLQSFLEELYGDKNIPVEFKKWAEELRAKDQHKHGQGHIEKEKGVSFKGGVQGVKKVKVQEGIGRALIHCREDLNLPVVSISSDLSGSTGVLPFRKKFPECSFDVGVAEANMVSLGAGFSKQGFIPVVDTFTQFGVTKGALPLFMANLSQAPVIAVFSHAGFQDAADGASHQSLTYLAQTGSLPLTDIYCLSSSAEAFALMTQAVQSFAKAYKEGKVPRTKIFFLGREVFPPSYLEEDYAYQLGKAQVVFSNLENAEGKGVTLWVEGPLVEQALSSGKILFEKGWRVKVVNASIVNHPDKKVLKECLEQTGFRLVTVEDHRLIGGMGAMLTHTLSIEGIKADTLCLSAKCDFGRSAYKSAELYKQEQLTSEEIVSAIITHYS